MTKNTDELPDDVAKITYFVDGVALTTKDRVLTAGQVLESAREALNKSDCLR